MRVFVRLFCFASIATFLCACGQSTQDRTTADIVLLNGAIHAVSTVQQQAEAIAIVGREIVAVGDNETVKKHIGPKTIVVELDQRLVMPGLVDAHLHPLGGAIKELFQCNFPFTATPQEIQDTVRSCVEEQPDIEWIIGGQWDSGFFERFELASPREFIDEVSGSVAVVLIDDSGHNLWVNSKALELAGITAETPDPAGGRIERAEDGSPNGVLLETADAPVYAVIPKYSDAQHEAAARWFSDTASAYGITAVKAANIDEQEMAAFQAVDRSGELNLHVATSMQTPYGHRVDPLDYADLDRRRDLYASEHVHTKFVKIFLDGVPTPARTAAMLDPYLPDAEHGDDFTGGDPHVSVGPLTIDLIELDNRGYTVKMHAAGDRSVRVGLDAIEAMRNENGDSGLRHELAHAGYIHPDDIPRFAEINAVADLSPIIWHPSPIIDAVISALGRERAEKYWPVRDLLDANAPVLAGSDWPSAVPNANPWVGIEALVTLRDPCEQSPGALRPEQAITLQEAVEIYTIRGARALRLDDRTGTIEVGKQANLIILERNIFDIPIEDVGNTTIFRTYFEGQLVYEAE